MTTTSCSGWVSVIVLALTPCVFGQTPTPVDASTQAPKVVLESYQALARRLSEQGQKFAEQSRYPEALKTLKEAYALDPSDPDIGLSLAYVHRLLGNRAAAERRLRTTIQLAPDRLEARQKLAELLAVPHATPYDLAEAAQLLAHVREKRGNRPRLVHQQARVAAMRNLEDEATEFYRQLLKLQPLDDDVALEMGAFFNRIGQPDKAMGWYRRAVLTENGRTQAAQAIKKLQLEQRAQAFGWSKTGTEIPVNIQNRLETARRLVGSKRFAAALSILVESIKHVPTHAMAYALLGDAYDGLERLREAEFAYLNAIAYDANSAAYALRLAELYEKDKAWAKAAVFLGRVLALKPSLPGIYLRRAKALQAAGDLAGALHQIQSALTQLPEDEPRDELEAMAERLKASLPKDIKPTAPLTQRDKATARARAHLANGDTVSALAVLRSVPPSKRSAAVLYLEAAVLESTGRLDDAMHLYQKSLTIAPDDVDTLESLGRLLKRTGRHSEAFVYLDRASRRGSTVAKLTLINDRLSDPSRIPVLSDLVNYFWLIAVQNDLRQMTSLKDHGPHIKKINQLEQMIQRRILFVQRLSLLVVSALIFLPLGLWFWRRRGLTLPEFVAHAPGASVDIQRILSAIRHEVLKHNTTALSGLATAMKDGADVVDRVAWVKDSLLGSERSEGAIERLNGYIEQLHELAKTHRCRLNLWYRDPALGAILKGFKLISQGRRSFDKITAGKPIPKGFINLIETSSALINGQGYRAILHILHELRILTVSRPALVEIFEGVRHEPAFEHIAVNLTWLDSQTHSLPCDVAVGQQDFEDCVRNPIRNAIEASLETVGDTTRPVSIGLSVEQEVEPITGLSFLAIRIFDQCPTVLDFDTIQNCSVEAGLGLVRQLMNRYEGSVSVEAGTIPWAKALVLRFPIVEEASTEWNL